MDGYDIAQICLNGHVISSMAGSSPSFRKDFCKECGSKTIMHCQECNKPIKGYYHVSGVIGGFHYDAPHFCDSCGNPFPWIKTKIETAKELVLLIDSISEEEKQDFQESIVELVKETAKVPIAKVKVKRYFSKIDSDISDGIKDVLKDILNDKLKKEIL